jgi:hypothetical protein
MVGKLALSVDGPEPKPCPFGGDQILLTAIVYRKSTIFGSSGGGTLRAQQDLFWNSRPGVWYENKTDRKTITDYYYLVVLPYNKIHTLDVEAYSTSGSQRTLHLQSQSRVSMDSAASHYEVLWNSTTIAKDETTTCPIGDGRIAFYSRGGGELTYPIPAHWNAAEVVARSLHVEKSPSHPVRIEAGRIKVDVPARIPVMVYGADRYIPAPGDSHATV